jgi:hypothetical protein
MRLLQSVPFSLFGIVMYEKVKELARHDVYVTANDDDDDFMI